MPSHSGFFKALSAVFQPISGFYIFRCSAIALHHLLIRCNTDTLWYRSIYVTVVPTVVFDLIFAGFDVPLRCNNLLWLTLACCVATSSRSYLVATWWCWTVSSHTLLPGPTSKVLHKLQSSLQHGARKTKRLGVIRFYRGLRNFRPCL